MPIHFRCSRCQRELSIAVRKVGAQVDCPVCRAALIVPAATHPKVTSPVVPPIPLRQGQPVAALAAGASRTSPTPGRKVTRVSGAVVCATLGILLVGLGGWVLFLLINLKPIQPSGSGTNDTSSQVVAGKVIEPQTPAQKDQNLEFKKEKPQTKPDKPVPVLPEEPTAPSEKNVSSLVPDPAPAKKDDSPNGGKGGKGNRILVWLPKFDSFDGLFSSAKHPLWNSLRTKGFEVKLEIAPQEPHSLSGADQLWLFSSTNNSPTMLAAVEKHVQSGKGLYLLADNPPYTFEANALAKKLFGTPVSESYLGMLLANVHRKGVFPGAMPKFVEGTNLEFEVFSEAELSKPEVSLAKFQRVIKLMQFQTNPKYPGYLGTYHIPDHWLLDGVDTIYEGVTISHFLKKDALEVVFTASDGNPLVGISRVPGQRLVLDCGFTRYTFGPEGAKLLPGWDLDFRKWTDLVLLTPGNLRFAENVAEYLAGKDEKAKK